MTKNSRRSGRGIVSKILLYAALILAAFYSVWPVFIMTLEGADIDLSPIFSGKGIRFVGGVPFYSQGIFPTLTHYLDALNLGAFPRLVGNSLVIAAVSIVITLAAGLPVAYILARIEIRGRSFIAYLLLALRTVSPFVVILPLYIYYTRIGLWDTYPGVALAELVLVLSVMIWMLRGFFSDIPQEVYDAAALFGGSEGQILRRVALPMILPGIVVTALFAFVLIWNEFLIADILTGPVTKTVAVGVWSGMGESATPFKSVSWDDLNAAGTLAFIPAIVVMLIIRKYLARGFSLATAR